MVKKKLNKSEQIRKLLAKKKSAKFIAEDLGCTTALVYQIQRKINAEIDKWKHKEVKVEFSVDDSPKVDDNPIPEFLQKGPLGSDTFAAWLAPKPDNDPINPNHYKQHGIETIDIIEAWDLNYRLGNVVKYISRAGLKDSTTVTNMYLEDLKKARWYLDREISHNE